MFESYDLDSLRKLVRDLEEENNRLRAQLRKAGSQPVSDIVSPKYTSVSEEFDPDQG